MYGAEYRVKYVYNVHLRVCLHSVSAMAALVCVSAQEGSLLTLLGLQMSVLDMRLGCQLCLGYGVCTGVWVVGLWGVCV